MAPSKRGNEVSASSDISLKALVFVDSCDNGVTAPKFGVLNSMHNVPLLTWQLAVLARYGVQEAIVLSRTPIDVESIPYKDPLDRMKITPLCSLSWACEGDALREVELRSDLRPQDDFVIVRHGAIFNLDVTKLVMEHKQRKAKDRNWLLSSVFNNRRISGGNVVMATNEEGMITKYDERNGTPNGINISLNNKDNNAKNNIIDVHSDVLDVGVDICAPEVLLEFKECFDYNRVRDLTVEKLDSGDAETMGNKMYARFVDPAANEYAARVVTLEQLVRVSRDVRNGYMMPVELEKYHSVEDGNTVQSDSKSLPLSSPHSSNVSRSVLGDGVTIGKNCIVVNSIIAQGSRLGDNVHLDSCIISDDCRIENDAKLTKGCVLDQGVVIGHGFQGLKEEKVLITTRRDEEFETAQDVDDDSNDDSEDEHRNPTTKINGSNWDPDEVGSGGVGRIISATVASRIDPYFIADSTDAGFDTSDSELSDAGSDDGAEIENGGEGANEGEAETTNGALNSTGVREEFRRELYELVEKGRLEEVELDNTLLEANSLRMVYDVTFPEMLSGVVIAIARNAMSEVEEEDMFAAYVRMFDKYAALTAKYVVAKDGPQVVTEIAEEFENEGMPLSRLLKVLYDTDVVEDDAILEWAKKELPPTQHPAMKELIEWLDDDDDDSD